jgi:alpha-tubulin suppressor-like RCC1 family protein
MAALADDFTVFVTEDGTVYACGRGGAGQLGLLREHQRQPARVGGAELYGDAPVFLVAAGDNHKAEVAEDGAIWTCGAGSNGQLGHGDAQDRLRPTRLGPEAFGGSPVVLVACGSLHTIAVTGDGAIWTCGMNCHGQLGHGDTTDRHVFTLVDPELFGGSSIVIAASGNRHNVVASAEGEVYTWGRGSCGRLGHNDEQDMLAPAQLGREHFGGGKIVFVAAGAAHTAALAERGVLWVWGLGRCGQLGLGDEDNRLIPTRLGADEVFGGSLVHTAACGSFHTLVVSEDGSVWTWGEGRYGRLGLNHEDGRLEPTRVDPQCFAGAQVTTVAGGRFHSAAVTDCGKLFTWGQGEAFQASFPASQVPSGLGHADLRNRLVPTPVSPRLLGGARVGRCYGLAEELALAFAMGTHARLGAGGVEGEGKGCLYLMMPGDLVERVVEACRRGRGEKEKLGEGVLRLMKARKRRGQT